MKREDIEKLLGGYAAGILTESERRELFEAAIKDQRLFDQLMREEALREMLEDPAARRRLMEASAPASKWFQRRFTWAVAGSLAAALVCGVFMVRLATPPSPPAAKLSMRAPKQDLPQPPPADFPARNVPVQPVRPERVKRKAASVPAEAPAPAAPVQLEEQARKESAPPGAVAESVEVAPTPVPQRDAMASGLSAASIAPEQRILYTIQRRTPEGSFLDLRPGDTLDPNDTVRLSLHARVSGTLNVTTSGGQINPRSLRIEAGNDYVLGPWQFPGQQGEKQLTLTIAEGVRAKTAMSIRAARRDQPSPTQPLVITLPYR